MEDENEEEGRRGGTVEGDVCEIQLILRHCPYLLYVNKLTDTNIPAAESSIDR